MRRCMALGISRGGVDAADKKLTTTFWQQATEAWSKQASRLATDETFLLLAKIGVAEYEKGVRRNALGWFEEMEGNTPKWIRFKQLSPLLQGVSPNESFFGHCKWSHDRSPQERVDAIGAHGSTKLNHTFDGKDFLRIKQNRLLLLMLRRAASAPPGCKSAASN